MTSGDARLEEPRLGPFLEELYRLLERRKVDLPEGSYTAGLFKAGDDAVLKKIAEEAAEVLLATKDGTHDELVWEASDLLFHLVVLLVAKGITLDEIAAELTRRHRPE